MRSSRCATSLTSLSIWDLSTSTRTRILTCATSWTHSSSIVCWSRREASLRLKMNLYRRVRKFRVPSSASWLDASLASWIISLLWNYTSTPARKTFGMKMYSREILSCTTLWKECQPTSNSRASTALTSLSRNGTRGSNNCRDLSAQWWRRSSKNKAQERVQVPPL